MPYQAQKRQHISGYIFPRQPPPRYWRENGSRDGIEAAHSEGVK
jgi:hypothetical protein